MSRPTRPRPIRADDVVAEFDCGEVSLNDYLRRRALTKHEAGASRCFVTTVDGRVVGYYALASAVVQHVDVTSRYKRNMPDPIPVVLISRLGVDAKVQRHGLGRHLLRDAILRSVEAAEIIGVRAILVHALHKEAARFYARYGFESSPTDPLHMMLLIKDARAHLGWK